LAPIGFDVAMVMQAEDLHALVRGEAFRQLLAAGVPATGEDLAVSIGISADKVARVLDELNAAGRIRRDEAGRVIGSAGLSVVADRHQIDFEGRRFWTWCAYDILGIFGVLRATGTAASQSPASAAPITIRFRDGTPRGGGCNAIQALRFARRIMYERLRRVVPEQQLLRRRCVGTGLVRESQTRRSRPQP
jgi:alkylmercury lyase-like protein